MASRSYPTPPPRTYLPPAVNSLPLIPNNGWVDVSTTTTTTTTASTTTTTATTTPTTTTTSTPTTTNSITTTGDDKESDGQVGIVDVFGNAIDSGEVLVEDEDEKGHAHDDDHQHEMVHDHVHERPIHNEPDFVLVEPVQHTQLTQMKT